MGVTATTKLFFGASVRALGGEVTAERRTATRYDTVTGEPHLSFVGNKVQVKIGAHVVETIDHGELESYFDGILEESSLERFQCDSNSYLIQFSAEQLLDELFFGVEVKCEEGEPIPSRELHEAQFAADAALKVIFGYEGTAKLHVITNYS